VSQVLPVWPPFALYSTTEVLLGVSVLSFFFFAPLRKALCKQRSQCLGGFFKKPF